MSQPATPLSLDMTDANQEVDVWWGSYSGWTMVPSFLVCFLLTGVIAWIGFTFTREIAQRTILGGSGGVWLIQIGRWANRFFGTNYRLTNRRLFIDRGFFYPQRIQVVLNAIGQVEVKQNFIERLVGVGRICLDLMKPAESTVMLEGVRSARAVAEMIQTARGLAPIAKPQAGP